MKLPSFLKSWTTPHQLTIIDPYLGILSWVLKLFVLLYVILMIAVNEQYLFQEQPGGYPTFWFEFGGLVAAQNAGSSYCNDAQYNYVYPSQNRYWDEQDIQCLSLDYGEMVQKSGKDAFAVTYLKREHKKRQQCTSDQEACSQIPGLQGARNTTNVKIQTRTAGVKTCSCGKLQDYFALGVDDMLLAIQHAFFTSTKMGSRGGSSTFRKHDIADDNDKDKVIETCVRKRPTPDECAPIGTKPLSKDDWSKCCLYEFGPGATLEKSIAEWIQSTGVSLDSRADSIVEPDRDSGLRPFRRITGLRLIFNLRYYGRVDQSEPIQCEIEVEHKDGWESAGSELTYVSFDSNGDADYYDSYRRGVRIEFSPQGIVKKFDAMTLLNTLISGLVFLGLVDTIVGFVAFYIHPNKSVFKKAKTFQLNYGRTLAQFGLQMALACHTFKDWNKDEHDDPEATLGRAELTDVFRNFFPARASHFADIVLEEATGGQPMGCKELVDLMSDGMVSIEALSDHRATKDTSATESLDKVVPVPND